MDQIIQPIIVLFILSLITEKITNFVKLHQPDLTLKKENDLEEKEREKKIQIITIVVGVIVAIICKANLFRLFDKTYTLFWTSEDFGLYLLLSNIVGSFFAGLFLSLGSRFFHDLLDILLQIKNLKRKLNDRTEWDFNTIEEIEGYINTNDYQIIKNASDPIIDTISKMDNVMSVYVEYQNRTPSIKVLVNEKFDNRNLIPPKVPYKNSLNRLSFINIHVIKSDRIIAHGLIFPGDGIGNANPYPNNYGSNGGVMYDKFTKNPFFVSCYHSVKHPTEHNWKIFTPNGYEDIVLKNNVSEVCGTIVNAIRDEEIDFAIIKPKEKYEVDSSISGIGIPYFTRNFNYDDILYETKVKMYGMNSQFSNGKLINYGKSVKIEYMDGNVHQLDDVILVSSLNSEPFSLPGDSGSYVLDEYDYLVGVLVGGNDSISALIPIDKIITKFNTQIHNL